MVKKWKKEIQKRKKLGGHKPNPVNPQKVYVNSIRWYEKI